MHQSGKIVACCSTALTVAAILGLASLVARQHPFWSRAASASVTTATEASPRPDAASGTERTETGGSDPSPTPQASSTSASDATPANSHPSDESVPPPPLQWSDREIEAALMECMHLLAPVTAEVVPLAPIRNGDCGTPAPVLLRSIGSKEKVTVDPPFLVNCPMIVALNRWLEKTVQPAATAAFGSPVARLIGSSYACRNRYNLPNDRLSQHAFANAIDLPVFILADGRRVDLATGWGPTRRDLVAAAKAKLVPIVAKETQSDPQAEKVAPPDKDAGEAKGGHAALTVVVKASASQEAVPVKASPSPEADPAPPEPKAKAPVPDPLSTPEAKFLRRVHQGACQVFSTVLGPEVNDVHRTHLHLDLQDRNALNVCE